MTPQRDRTARHEAPIAAQQPETTNTPDTGPGTGSRRRRTRTAIAGAVVLPLAVAPFLSGSAASPEPAEDTAWSALEAASSVTATTHLDPVALAQRNQAASRGAASRALRPVTLKPRPVAREYATAPLNIWPAPREQGKRLGLVKRGTRLGLTGQVVGHWAEAVIDGKARWVNADYLSKKKPAPASSTSSGAAGGGGVSTAPCPDGSGTESGLTSNAVMMFRAVCNAFPELTTYGGYDGHGEHADGRAVDFMTYENTALGNAVAEWARANAGALNIRTIIWAQKIWTPERASEGWRYMSDRGSATANHYDHPHISVY